MVGCGSTSTVASPQVPEIVGAPSCPADQAQDLTFTGAIAGRLKCSTAPAVCLPANGNALRTIGMTAPIGARVGLSAVQLLIVFELVTVQAGTYPQARSGMSRPAARQASRSMASGTGRHRRTGAP